MSETAAKRHPIDLDEFDRRLRGTSTPVSADTPTAEDPLAELARLVSASPDPFAPLFANGRPGGARGAQPPFPRSAAAPPPPPVPDPAPQAGAELRPSLDDEDAPSWGRAPEAAPAAQRAQRPFAPSAADSVRLDRGRSRRSVLLMSGALALGLFGIAGALALKGHGGVSGAPPTIMADAKPYKVRAPLASASKDPPVTGASILDKQNQTANTPAHLVNTEEQPVDLASVGDGPGAASTATSSAFPPAKRVKTVSVRPDGSIITGDDPAPGVPQPQPQASNDAPPQAPASPAPATAQASDSGRGSAGQEATGASFASVVDQAADAPPAPAPTPAATPAAPRPPSRPKVASHPPREDVASIPSAQAALGSEVSGGAGAWAVQLAAPGSPREAHSEILRLEKRYSSQLSGHALGAHQAQSNGRTVYRVRAAGLSREAAAALCGRIKAGGGACFVARD